MLTRYANPQRFLGLAGPTAWALGALAVVFIGLGISQGWAAPPEQDQGVTARILYIHVPSAWMSMAVYVVMAAASLVWVVWRHSLADLAAKAAAPLGAVFALITLISGSLWGRPTWGTWWVWDGRLTSMLVLLLIYLGYIALRAALEESPQAPMAGAILCLFGLANLPIVKFSVDWWSTLHQPASVLRLGGPTLATEYLVPLLYSFVGHGALFGCLLLIRMQSELLRLRARRLGEAHG